MSWLNRSCRSRRRRLSDDTPFRPRSATLESAMLLLELLWWFMRSFVGDALYAAPPPRGPLMTCREFIDSLVDLLAEDLPEEQRAVFERHLAVCPSCVAYLETYRKAIELGKAAFADPEAPIPNDVPEQLVQAILAARRTR